MNTNLDLFSDFLALLALEQATGQMLFTPFMLSAEQKKEISRDAVDKVLRAIFSPDDLPDFDE